MIGEKVGKKIKFSKLQKAADKGCSTDKKKGGNGNGTGFTGGTGTPAYLSVDGFEKCLGKQSHGEWESWCFPAARPNGCDESAYDQLSKLPIAKNACY